MMCLHLHNSMILSADMPNLPTDQAIPTVSLKAPIATDAILDSITDEPRLEKTNRYIYGMGIVFTLLVCVVSFGLYFLSR